MFTQRHDIIIRRLNKSEFVSVYGKGTTIIWNQVKKENKICYLCKKEPSYGKLEVEHIIPVCFGGDEIGINNLNTVCHKCHLVKTTYDRKLIHICKKLNLVSGSKTLWVWKIKDVVFLHNLYLFLSNLIRYNDKIRELEYAEQVQRGLRL